MRTLIPGDANLLKLDIDAGMKRPRLYDIMRRLHRAGGYRIRYMMEKRSRSGKGWHIVLKVSPIPKSAAEVVALQVILGSDPDREACNLWRAKMLPKVSPWWRKRWNVLYT